MTPRPLKDSAAAPPGAPGGVSGCSERRTQSALSTRIVIEQAKGVLAEHGMLDMQDAYAALRDYARANNRKLGAVAEQLVRREIPASELLRR